MQKEEILTLQPNAYFNEELVGGKAFSLFKLTSFNFPIAKGIVLTTKAYEEFLKKNKLENKIKKLLRKKNFTEEDSKKLKSLIQSSRIPQELMKEIYERLKEIGILNSRLIVRSSANIEDTTKYSFAGEFTTLLNVDKKNLSKAIVEVYSSLFNFRALKYAEKAKIKLENIKMAIIIQEFIKTDFAGVAFSINPATANKERIVIEYVEVLGENLVAGKLEPVSVEFDKKSFKKVNEIFPKREMKKISDEKLFELARIVKRIEECFGICLDIEWGIKDSRIIIFQARPITTLQKQESISFDAKGFLTLKGIPASSGVKQGRVRIVRNRKELKKLKKGEILICTITYDNYLPQMLKAGAIVTQLGGITSHAAIVARENKIPCVVGVANAMQILNNNMQAIVDGTNGIVYYKGKKKQQELIPEEAMDFVFERIKPYRIVFEKDKVLLKRISIKEHIKEPKQSILLEEFEKVFVAYLPKSIKISKKKIENIQKILKKKVVIGEEEKFETYTTFAYGYKERKEFRKLLKEAKRVAKNEKEIDSFSRKCLKLNLKNLEKAERLLRKTKLSIKEISLALELINDAALFFGLVNTVLTTGYGIDYLRKEYKKIQQKIGLDFSHFVIAVDEGKEKIEQLKERLKGDKRSLQVFEKIVKIYKEVAKWKFESDKLDRWNKRKELWKKASAKFEQITSRDINELLKDQYGSGVKLKEYLKANFL